MAVVVLVCTVSLWKLAGINNTPDWWQPLDSNPQITEQSGIELENRITTALTRLRQPGEESWAAAINQDQLNSWLTHRLRETVRSFSANESTGQSINQLGDIQIKILPTGITIGARIIHAHGSTIVWAIIDLGTDTRGRFTINTQRAYIGNARIPAGLVSKYLTSEKLGNASIDLGDGRVVRILGIRAGDQRLELALRTELAD